MISSRNITVCLLNRVLLQFQKEGGFEGVDEPFESDDLCEISNV
jgi:hypothetical protein